VTSLGAAIHRWRMHRWVRRNRARWIAEYTAQHPGWPTVDHDDLSWLGQMRITTRTQTPGGREVSRGHALTGLHQ